MAALVDIEPPPELSERYADRRWTLVREWPARSRTWRLDGDGRSAFLKVGRADRHPNGVDECVRTRWAGEELLPVPQVLGCGTVGELDWLLTAALGGADATRHLGSQDPERLVVALARGLAAFHDLAPPARCPYRFGVEAALAHVDGRLGAGLIDVHDLSPEHRRLGVAGAVAQLHRLAPPDSDLVVCHGDYCPPNVLLDDDLSVVGFVDLGELGVADRWWDVAVGAWSVTWNLGPGMDEVFYAAYGITRDDRRIAFHRLLYDLAS